MGRQAMRAYGLQTHIWNNQLKSVLLLLGFPVLLMVLWVGILLVFVGFTEPVYSYETASTAVIEKFKTTAPYAFLGSLIWFLVAWVLHQRLINLSVGARGLERKEAPDLYNLLENLCISRGITMPKLSIIESPALNAFASGISDKNYAITVTRGLVDTLDDREMEAVLAHELTHIENQDVRLLIVAVIFVGIFSFVAEALFEVMFRSGLRVGGQTRSRNGDSRGGGMLIIAGVLLIAIAYALALVVRFALSQKREYLADAGAVDLTRDPEAMVSALETISGQSNVEAPSEVKQMMVDNPVRFMGVFATHPPIRKRIDALREYAA
ncbi:MAG: M48 family metallopeptidase [Pseudomonadota bacterium]